MVFEGGLFSNETLKKERLGYESKSKKMFAYWNGSASMGGEHACKIKVQQGPRKLEDVSFNIIRNVSDSILVRVNFYKIRHGLPEKNISKGNILYTITKKSGRVIIDLSPYEIVVKNDFIVSGYPTKNSRKKLSDNFG